MGSAVPGGAKQHGPQCRAQAKCGGAAGAGAGAHWSTYRDGSPNLCALVHHHTLPVCHRSPDTVGFLIFAQMASC